MSWTENVFAQSVKAGYHRHMHAAQAHRTGGHAHSRTHPSIEGATMIVTIVLVLIVALAIALTVGAVRLKPTPVTDPLPPSDTMGDDRSVQRFQAILQSPTVWAAEDPTADHSAFDEFVPKLEKLYPDVFAHLELTMVNTYGIMLKWKGTDPTLKPVVLMGHHDVVEADPTGWTHDPFDAQVVDGRIYARGALDNKALWTCLLEATDALLKQGYTPPRDIYLSSTNSEEDSGDTTPRMVEWLHDQGIEPEFVLDEGGAVIDDPPFGVKVPFATIGVSEKGCVNTFITCSADGGHASTPTPSNAPIKLVRALAAIEDHPAPSRLLPPVEALLKELAAHSGFGLRVIFGNLWLFRPLVLGILKGNGETAAMVRTTYALTELGGSQAVNVLPKRATAGYSVRVNPNETAAQAIDRLKSHLGEGFEVRLEHVTEPSPVSPFDDEDFDYLRRIINCVYPDAGIAPYIQSSGSDSRHFNAICPRVYRFAGILFGGDQRGRIHGQDENIGVDAFKRGVGFYIELIRHLDMLGR